MGPRIGRFDKKGRPVPMPGHSVPLSALGGLILIFGFFACNGTKQVSNRFYCTEALLGLEQTVRCSRTVRVFVMFDMFEV